ncbi:LysR family transcriptional regulator, partial [Citrobacter freundii]
PLLQHVNFTQYNQHIPCSFIINEPQCIFRQRFEGLLRKRQITLENTIELWSIESIKQCVSANLGVSFLPRFAVERELRSGELIELPYSEQPELITALCGYHAGKVVSPAMRVFLECIEESFASREKMPG